MLAFFELALIAVTWRLWSTAGDVPRVPLLTSAFPSVVFFGASAFLVVGCVSMLLDVSFWAKHKSLTAGITLIAGCVCVLGNQQCLQAWHWLFLLSLGLWLLTDHVAWPDLMQHVLCTIYVCSALSRLTLTPETGITAVLSRQLLQWAGVSEFRQADLLPGLCHGLSIGELLIGVLLLFRRTRPPGIVAAEVLHVTLLLVLGPFGLNHHAGVLIWNMCLIVLVPIVFRRPERVPAISEGAGTRSARSGLPRAIVTSIIWLWPLSGLFGFADNWPSWQLYSNRPEIWTLYVRQTDAKLLPESVRSHVGDAGALEEFLPVRLDRWVLEETGSPMYPEDRFQFAIIRWCIREFPENANFEVRVSEPQSRWWRRTQRVLRTTSELEKEHSRFILNSAAD